MSNARRRRSSIADLTGRLLIDDMDDESAPLAAAPPNSPLDSSAGAKGAGAENNPYIFSLMAPLMLAIYFKYGWGTA